MILLDDSTQKLQAVLAGAITTDQPEFQTTYGVLTLNVLDAYETNQGELNDTTDVDLVVGQSSKQIGIKSISLYNRDTVSVTVTFKKDISATDRFLYRAVLAANESVHYESGFGWSVVDANGVVKKDSFSEINDLTALVTWANIPDANVPESAITQHEAAIDHDALANFDSAEHFLQSAISIPASQISDFDTEVSNNASVVANTAKVTNATHTAQVTGATALVLDITAVTAQPASGAIVAADTIIINDGGVLSEATFTQMLAFFDANISFPAEVNDLSIAVVWANVPDANITEASVTQHEAALTILESQITDGSILARLAATETVAGTWTMDAVIPTLAGSLVVNGNKIVSTSDGDIDIEPDGTGNVLLGNMTFDADQTIGAGQDNFVLTFDNAAGVISLEAVPGGGGMVTGISKNSGANVNAADRSVLNFIEGSNITLTIADDAGGDEVDITIAADAPEDKIYRIGHTYAIAGEIKVPSGDTDFIIPFFVGLASGQTAKIVKARHIINAGTSVTCKLQKNGSDITGFTSISVTTTVGSTDPTDVTIADDDKIALVVTGVSGTPKNLSFTIFFELTQ